MALKVVMNCNCRTRTVILFILIIFETHAINIEGQDCPVNKQAIVNCSDLGIKTITVFPILMNQAQGLDLSRNKLTSFKNGLFDRLVRLAVLNLCENQIETLDGNIFAKLTKLQHLRLCKNKLEVLDSKIFDSLTQLLLLDLDDNKLKTLDGNIFSSLAKLKLLVLTHNHLENLDGNIFEFLTKLKQLFLGYNALKGFVPGTFESLINLQDLDLQNNKLEALDENIFVPLIHLKQFMNSFSRLDLSTENPTMNINLTFYPTANSSVDVSDNQLHTLDENIFVTLSMLIVLDLNFNQLNNLDEKIFETLSSLQKLLLNENKLMDFVSGIFDTLVNLELLYLADNPIPTLDHRLFDALTKLEMLVLPMMCNCSHNRLFLLPFMDSVQYDVMVVLDEKKYTDKWQKLTQKCSLTWIDHPYCDIFKKAPVSEWSEWNNEVDCSGTCGRGKQILTRMRYLDCIGSNTSEVKILECYGNDCNGSALISDNWYENMKSNTGLKAELKEELEAINNELKVDKKTTNVALRRRVSVFDYRMSSTVMGGFAALTVLIPFVFAICSDLCNCVGRQRSRKTRP